MKCSYLLHKSLLHFLNDYCVIDLFYKCTIEKSKVTKCENKTLCSLIQDKILDMNIENVTFYIVNKESSYYNIIKHLPFETLPIYNLEMDFKDFINKYIDIISCDIHCYETKKYEKVEYNFDNSENCFKIKPYNTNPEYPTFTQSIYHAGNIDNINRHGTLIYMSLFNYLDNSVTQLKYTPQNIDNTLHYMFDYLKRGIMVGIKNNKLVLFLPFSKYDYINDFYNELYFDENDKKLLEKLYSDPENKELITKSENTVKYYFKKYKLSTKDMIFDRRKWFANGCFFRHDTWEGDKLVLMYQDIITQLCKTKKLNDTVFFMNVRDFPMLRKDRHHPYSYITTKMIPEIYRKNHFAPILSVCSSDHYEDIPMITPDDWMRISQKYYPEACKNPYESKNDVFNVPWQERKAVAFFRGSATGCGTDASVNMRLKALQLSNERPDLIDAGITTFNRRIKKRLNKPLDLIDTTKINKAEFITNEIKATFKYVLNIDGHVSAFRLGHELQMGSVVLLAKSHYYIWFSKMLIPFVHYVPVKCDLSDLFDVIEWCRNNDDKCLQISISAKEFYYKYLSYDGVMNHLANTINSMSLIKEIVPIIKVAIIICYRDTDGSRFNQLVKYRYIMSKMFKNYNINYKILIVEQSEKYKFNIGKLKNIGFDYLSKEHFDNYIFTDVDMLPDYDLFKRFITVTDGINMLAVRGTRYKIINNEFYGGCIGCTKDVFQKVNGYSNLFIRGWGGEDENFGMRCRLENITHYVPSKGRIIDIEEMEDGLRKDVLIKVREEKASDNYDNLKFETLLKYNLYKEDGLNNLKYKILNEYLINDNYVHIVTDIMNDEHVKAYSKHFSNDDFTMEKYEKYRKYFFSFKVTHKYF